jgi:hypothetical protein
VLLLAGPIIEVEADPPRRAGLVVVIPARHDHGQVIKRQPVGPAPADLPGQHELADAIGGSPASTLVYPAARADGLTIARLEVAARDRPHPGRFHPCHAAIQACPTVQVQWCVQPGAASAAPPRSANALIDYSKIRQLSPLIRS